ncbi:MAG: pentapeptide repeat-containing protein [Deltaproteobacteria bacterium]|jgi:uncharacterized protein YjbI with pentapeptide repeats|nr:pentapeptide repeat-containing protein [Deltaproteobacteria bacterium]
MNTRKFTQSPLLVSCQTVRFGGRPYLAVTAFLGFNLDGVPGALSPADSFGASAKALEELADQGVVFDLGLPKIRGEFLAAGSAFPPPGAILAGSAAAGISVGPLAREFLAVGEAPLLGIAPGDPAPYLSLPLDWRRTAAGPFNPHGQVQGASRTAYGAVLGYPQVTDRREGGGALAAAWPPPASPLPEPFGKRQAASGTYGRDWLLDSWPGFPADFELDALSLAQPAQRLPEGAFRGDEAVLVRGMHPQRAELRGRLPGLAARVVVARIPPGAEAPDPPAIPAGADSGPLPDQAPPGFLLYAEPRLGLDTVWLFPFYGAGILIWHGTLETADALGQDVWGLAGAVAPLGTPAERPQDFFARGVEGFPPLPEVLPFAVTPPPPVAVALPGPEAPPPEAVPEPEEPPVAEGTPAAEGIPAPPPPPPEEAPAPPELPPVTAAAIVADVRKSLEADLPELNSILAEQGLSPVTMEDLDRSLQRYGGALNQGFAEMDKYEAAEAALKAMTPAERAAAERASMIADLTKGGVSPGEAADIVEALELPVPVKADFRTAEEFERALSSYGSEWARLIRVPEESGRVFAEKMRTVSLMQEDPQAGIEALLGQTLGKEKAASLMKELVAPPVPALDTPAAAIQDLIQEGVFSKAEAEALIKGVAHLQAIPAGSGMAEITQALSGYGEILAQGFGAGTSGYVGKMLREFQAVKAAYWRDPLLGKALDGLTARFPALRGALPELNRLRAEAPQAFPRLTDAARAAGITDPALLAAIDLEDPWTGIPQPAVTEPDPEPEPGPDPEPEPGPEPAEEPPGEPGTVIASRAEVERLAWLARTDPARAGILSGKVMMGLVLAGADLSGLDLSGARLTGSDLSDVSFAGSDLSAAALDGCLVGGADFSRAILAGADLSRVSGGAFAVDGADLEGADFTGADLSAARLAGARAPRAAFGGARLPSDLKGADLAGATFSRWNGEGADLSGADLVGATFANVNLAGALFAEARLERCSFVTCDLSRAVFRNAGAAGASFLLLTRLPEADFSGADLSGATFSVREASGARFTGARGTGASFTGARLRGSSFQGGVFREAVFHEADLRGSDFFGADLMRARFGGAHLAGAAFQGASLYAADFYLSRPDGSTDFKGADLTNTILLLEGESLVR